MNTPAEGAAKAGAARALRPRDAATLIIVDRAGGRIRVLMGQRRMDQAFMPGKFVFPGGRVDKSDRAIPSVDELRPAELAKLMLGMKGTPSPHRARALALAAIRETFEETGIVIGSPASASLNDAGPPIWASFFGHGYQPRLSGLTMLARAITPPGRPRRYDTRFFCIGAEAIAHHGEPDDEELSKLEWVTIEAARNLDLPAITRVILEDLAEYLQAETQASTEPWSAPYYHHHKGSFKREMLRVPFEAQQLDTAGLPSMLPQLSADHRRGDWK